MTSNPILDEIADGLPKLLADSDNPWWLQIRTVHGYVQQGAVDAATAARNLAAEKITAADVKSYRAALLLLAALAVREIQLLDESVPAEVSR